MTVDISELQESAQRVLGDLEAPAPEETMWSHIVELGWLLVAVPEELGGLGVTVPGAVLLQQELGAKLTGAPYLPALLALDAVCNSQHADQESWIERLIGGELVTAPLADGSVRIEAQGEGYLVTGTATAVQSADLASHLLVWNDVCVALVPLDQAGVTRTERRSWDLTRRLFDVEFSQVQLSAEHVLAAGPEAVALARRLGTQRDFGLAADAVGGATALLDLTVEHLQTRQQFGRPLALFQALKHRCADLKTLIAGAEAALLDSVGRCGETIGSEEAALKGTMAKLLGCSAFARVAEESLQLHGGIGMASEHPCHLFLKRAMLSEHLGRGGDSYEQELAAAFLDGVEQ